MTTTRAIDVSGYQAGINPAAVGAQIAIVKLTEGTTFRSKGRDAQVAHARRHGLGLGYYHYINGRSSPAQEMSYFLADARRLGTSGAVICLDWESGGNRAWGNLSYLEACIKHIIAATGKPPVLYASASVFPWALAARYGCARWVAQYGSTAHIGWTTSPWRRGWTPRAGDMHQYTGTGRLPGWAGALDLNIFYGSLADWIALAVGTTTQTPSKPTQPEDPPAPTYEEDDMILIRATAPWGDYAYAEIHLSGLGGARSVEQVEADMLYPALGVKAVTWDQWNWLVNRAWEIHNQTLEQLGRVVTTSVEAQVAKVLAAADPAVPAGA